MTQVKCYNCNTLGHMSRNCPRPRRNRQVNINQATSDGQDHDSEEDDPDHHEPQQIFTIRPQSDVRSRVNKNQLHCVQVHRNGNTYMEHTTLNLSEGTTITVKPLIGKLQLNQLPQTEFLIDSGSSENWVSQKTFDQLQGFIVKHNFIIKNPKLHHQIVTKKTDRTFVTGNGTAKPKQVAFETITLRFDCKWIKQENVKMYILPEQDVNILGERFLTAHQATLSYTENGNKIFSVKIKQKDILAVFIPSQPLN